jgi:hypothetical protein
MNPDVGTAKLLDPSTNPPRRSPRKSDDKVSRVHAVNQLGKPLDLADHRDRVGLRMDRELTARPDPTTMAFVASVDEPDDRQIRPISIVQTAGDPTSRTRIAQNQKAATIRPNEIWGSSRRGNCHGCLPIHRCQGREG